MRQIILFFHLLTVFASCNSNGNTKIEGGCNKCFCNEFSDTDGDDICDTRKNNNQERKCRHSIDDHS